MTNNDNAPQIPEGPETFTFEGIERLVFQFESFIRQHQAGLELPKGSPIEAAGLAAIEMLETFRGQIPHDTKKDHRPAWRQAIALGDLLRKLHSGSNSPGFPNLWPHVNLLLQNCNFAQNTAHRREDTDGDKVFELYIALLLLPLCSALQVDDPVHSAGGKNPDLIAIIDGERWAFACKVMHSDSPKSLLDRVKDGVRQLKAAKMDKGIVVISLKSVIPHDQLWPVVQDPDTKDYIYFPWTDAAQPINHLRNLHAQYEQSKVDEVTLRDALQNALVGDGVVPMVLLHLCSTTTLTVQGVRMPFFPRMFCGITVGTIPRASQRVLDRLNDSLHDRFMTFPAQPPSPPAT